MNMKLTNDRKKELESKITDLEDSLTNLKQQLNKEKEEEQHEAIDNLDDYLEEIDHKYTNLKDFWSILGKEIKGLFSRRADDDTNNSNDTDNT